MAPEEAEMLVTTQCANKRSRNNTIESKIPRQILTRSHRV